MFMAKQTERKRGGRGETEKGRQTRSQDNYLAKRPQKRNKSATNKHSVATTAEEERVTEEEGEGMSEKGGSGLGQKCQASLHVRCQI